MEVAHELFHHDSRHLLARAATPTYRTTKYDYDQVGNTTKVYSPRATTAGSTTAFISQTVYDELNRPKETIQPYDPNDTKYNHPVSTYTYYDDAGRVTKTSAPPSNGLSVRNDTTYSYYDDGQVHTSTDPWDITTTYDYNDLGKQISRTLTSAGGSSSRTMGWSYYPDGSLAARSDDGVPVGLQVVLVDNSDTQNTTTTGTWATASTGTDHQGYDYRAHAAGSGTDAFTWQLNMPQDGTYTVYAKYPQVTGAATAAAYTVTHDGTNTAKTVNQTTGAGTWVSLGAYSFTQGGTSSVSLAQNTGGTVSADAVKLVRDNSADTDNEKHTFTYSHDPNGNLTTIGDSSPGTAVDTYTIDYTGLNQVQKVTESASGTEKTHTSYTYDPDGQSATVDHPGQYSTYTYDLRELVQTVKVGTSATDPSPKTTTYTYTPRGQQLRQTKANNNTVDFTYWPSGEPHTHTEKTAGNTLVDDHTLTWDPNGNKAEDIASKQNADNHTAYLNSTTDYTYDPADRLEQAAKTGNGADTETYVHDDNANVISQTVQGTATTYTYDRNRLLSSASGGTSAAYNYDPYGRLDTITSAGTVIERNTYDGFDHISKNTKLGTGGVSTTTTYAFDPLDRTASKTVGGKTTDFSYLGLSSQILDETVAGQLSKSYQYSPWGERLSQVTHNTDGTTTDSFYGYNSHTDVEILTDSTGQTKATYGYTAYGNNDTTEFTGIDKPDAQDPTKEPYNAYRFNAKRWDQSSGTYDMGFRNYDPGLNTFTSRDMYNGALADMNLSTDPLTGNRYAFGGGNPTSTVEIDGHFLGPIGGAIDDIGSALKDGAQALEGALSGTAEAAASEGSSLLSDATPWGIAASVFAYASKPTSTASNGYESDPGEKPDYSKGLLLKPDSVKEWQPGDARVPFTREDCAKSRSSMIYYMPLDSQGRAQGAIACLNKADINYADKDGNLKDPNNSTKMVGSTTMWPMSTPGAWAASPKGWRPGIGLDRSHLVARRFGGSGTDRRNLVPLPSDVNQDSMGAWEAAISQGDCKVL